MTNFDFHNLLVPIEFERFCLDIIKVKEPNLNFKTSGEWADNGIDLLCTTDDKNIICQCKLCPDNANNTIKITSEIKKSTKLTTMVLSGIIILGKYTFENKFELLKIELLTSLNTLENNCHNNIPAATYTKLFATLSPVLILLAINPKTKTLINGLTMAHKIPAKACL